MSDRLDELIEMFKYANKKLELIYRILMDFEKLYKIDLKKGKGSERKQRLLH